MIYQQHQMISSDSLTSVRPSHQQLRASYMCICQEMMSRVDAHDASQTRVSEIESHAYHAMHDKDFIEGMQEYLAALVACLLSLPPEGGSSYVFCEAGSFIFRASTTVFVAVNAASTKFVELDQSPLLYFIQTG